MKLYNSINGSVSIAGGSQKGLLAIVFLQLLLLSTPVDAQGLGSKQGIAAIVNDDIISVLDLASRINFTIFSSKLPNNRQVLGRIKPQILRTLINEKLQQQEARRVKIRVPEEEVNSMIREIERRNKMPQGEMRKVFLNAGIDWRTFKQQIETQLSWRLVIQRRVYSNEKIGEDAIDEQIVLIETNKGKPEYLVGEIFLPFDSGKTVDNVRQIGDRLYSQIRKGASFPDIARSFSQSASAANDGNLGWIRADQLDDILADFISKMIPGSISPPMKGADGFYILSLQDKRTAKGLPPPDISVTFQQVFLPLRSNASPGEVSAQNNVAKTVSAAASNCQDMARLGKEKGAKQSGRLNNIKLSALPENFQNAIQKYGVGKASGPLRTPAGFIVVMLCSKSGDGSKNVVRQKIERSLLEQKASLVSRRLLRDLRRAAFVDIR